MARNLYLNGESLVSVKGMAGTAIANLSQLGLTDPSPIPVSFNFHIDPVLANAWGKVPFNTQWMGATAQITMSLVHFDNDVLNACIQESMGGGGAVGQMARAGTVMGASATRFAAGNHFIGLNIYSPVQNIPWRFYWAYLSESPMTFPLGVERSIVQLTWTAIPFTLDPWNNGQGATNAVLFDHVLDT